MTTLLILMLERVGILLIVVFLLSRMSSFRKIIDNEHGMKEKMLLIAVFGTFGIISNYTGIEIRGGEVSSQVWQTDVDLGSALANTRVLGVALGGLLGGPLVGLGVGMIAGLHRMTLGGFTAVACGVSTLLAGIVTGLIGKRFQKNEKNTPWRAVVIGIVMECVQMGIILMAARPFEDALTLVKVIAMPMILINGFGTLLFMLIIQSILQEEERTRALQTHKALYIADQTMPFFRQGLNAHSCREVAAIILKWTNADAISITNQHQVLAHVGTGADHHVAMKSVATQLTKNVLEQGRILKARSREEIQCFHQSCTLHAAIVLPLKVHGKTAGTLKLYFTNPNQMDQVEQELAEGLGKLFSTQLELAEAELQSKLLKDAEIKALQAQVHPHFLFNAINTISVLCRTDSEKARELLLKLSVFFRSNLQGARQMLIPLQKELEHVEAYLSLEQARFPDKYKVCLDIEPSIEKVLIPPFTLQPLVENAVRHAFLKSKTKRIGQVTVRAYEENDQMVLVTEDNGNGIDSDLLDILGKRTVDSAEGTGTALYNIRKRIEEIYGEEARFHIQSERDAGTKIVITLPLSHNQWGDQHAESLYRG
ncbi:LytS/YhcK type 5TM receptor domain-containing protein [Paenibacillus allorhizosphaerae]|uniref:Sensor histidine kinase YpdA n=1 Tax=Paenibacillus allorhizosphaerae TaxID=2849866 RepID=A0ABM8VQB7_9BACL|nr:sensor histidine kinase [Paenibacillus allorhizosphaerae]CAG7653933.1 Sensor histidine kinase YpdA [Paenibacillus allorhizosphaerae]